MPSSTSHQALILIKRKKETFIIIKRNFFLHARFIPCPFQPPTYRLPRRQSTFFFEKKIWRNFNALILKRGGEEWVCKFQEKDEDKKHLNVNWVQHCNEHYKIEWTMWMEILVKWCEYNQIIMGAKRGIFMSMSMWVEL